MCSLIRYLWEVNWKITTYGEYFNEFYSKLEREVQEKVDWVFQLVKAVDQIPKKFFQHLETTDGIYEIRVEFESNIYRIFCFFWRGTFSGTRKFFSKKVAKNSEKRNRVS